MKGKLIVFEGIDGCGKGVQLKLVASWLFDKNKGYDIFVTREPTRDFKEIREKLSRGIDVRKDAEWYTKMFIEDRRNHLSKYIVPILNNGTHVLCDRYKHSTLVYQHTQGMNFGKLVEMHFGLLVPDLTIIFDCPAEVAFERRRKEGASEIFDKDLEFQKRLRENYLKLKERLPDENIVVIDSSRPVSEIFSEVKQHINKIL